jgi:hypothetical protein
MSSVNSNNPNDPSVLNQELIQEEILQEEITNNELTQQILSKEIISNSQNGTAVAPSTSEPVAPAVQETQQRKMKRLGHHNQKV